MIFYSTKPDLETIKIFRNFPQEKYQKYFHPVKLLKSLFSPLNLSIYNLPTGKLPTFSFSEPNENTHFYTPTLPTPYSLIGTKDDVEATPRNPLFLAYAFLYHNPCY